MDKEVTMNDKIKHLLATAYKTDAIAQNKWRIENREQLREQRKQKLKELMEKDKQDHIGDTNKMAGIANWLEQEFLKLESTVGVHGVFYELLEKAKAMQENEYFEVFKAGQESMEEGGKGFEQYYNETFGGNNEQQ